MQPDPTPEISQEAARAMLAALRAIRGFPHDLANAELPNAEAVKSMARMAHDAIALAEGRAS
jgi:hypothetical protein